MEHTKKTVTVFEKTEISEPALFSPSDTTKRIENFPEICVSTFSEAIIQKFSSLNTAVKIAELYTANGMIPVYKIRYKDTEIAFYLSRVGALHASLVLKKLLPWAQKNLFCLAPAAYWMTTK